ncbi:type II toxin-antitoxin system VapC family toxin [bacterium]|nr:type II toxin-antitoxin system VapC family toxin [bacterium]
MAIYVVDASVVIQYAITQTYTSEAQALIARMYLGDRLYIPEFCLLECTNVLWKQVRFQGLPQSQARAIINELLALAFDITPTVPLLSRTLPIGLSCELAIYDSLYIALALELNCPLVTVDIRQEHCARASGATLVPITDFAPI